jgi:hypothetical protein
MKRRRINLKNKRKARGMRSKLTKRKKRRELLKKRRRELSKRRRSKCRSSWRSIERASVALRHPRPSHLREFAPTKFTDKMSNRW